MHILKIIYKHIAHADKLSAVPELHYLDIE